MTVFLTDYQSCNYHSSLLDHSFALFVRCFDFCIFFNINLCHLSVVEPVAMAMAITLLFTRLITISIDTLISTTGIFASKVIHTLNVNVSLQVMVPQCGVQLIYECFIFGNSENVPTV